MFEILINLILASLFFQAQTGEQATLKNFSSADYRLLPAERRELQETAPQLNNNSPTVGVKVTAQSALAIDADTGKVLFEKNTSEVRSIASLTKLMTALVFLEHNPGWDKEVLIESSDYREGGINRLMAGEKVTVQDVFYATLVTSSNEAAVALAKSTGLRPEEFVQVMNNKANELGMENTNFIDLTGLDPQNKSTAIEIVILAQTAFRRPEIFKAAGTNDYEITILNKNITRKISNTDKILNQTFGIGNSSYRVEAGKTGYLAAAGYSFTSQITDQSGRRILAVVLGSATIDDRFVDTKSLAYWVYNNYLWQ